jgi:nucleoside-diphosphate-sugar epimerase
MKVFVTGASGAIGRPAVDRLLEAGHDVTALVRSDGTRDQLERAGARAVPGSLFDADALRTALAGHDAVVNLATHIPSAADAIKPGAWRQDDRIRTEGSRVLAGAALAAGVGRLVQESVSFVYPDSGDSWITEQTPPAPNPRSQAPTMAAAASATRFAAHGGIGVVLRFGLLYGSDRNSGEMLTRVRAGKPVVLGQPAGWLSALHPEDAARAVAAALACDSGIYNVCETPVLRSDWAAAIGRAARGGAAREAAREGDTAGPAAKFYPRLLQRLAGARAEPLTRSHRVSSAAFRQATGWRPHYDCLRGGWSASPTAASR